jgi:hypothetical protein
MNTQFEKGNLVCLRKWGSIDNDDMILTGSG